MNARLVVAAIVAGLVAAGCATAPPGAKLTYETSPQGAILYEAGQALGIGPVTRNYAGDAAGGRIRTPEVTAVWPSGAKASFWTFLKPGDDNITTLSRPANAPGLQADLDNALKYQDADARAKAAMLRDQARNSARCKAQQHSGAVGVDDCD